MEARAAPRSAAAALLAAALLAATLPLAGAVHDRSDQEVEFRESWEIDTTMTDKVSFSVESSPPDTNLLCYLRVTVMGYVGSWSATVYDDRGRPVLQDTAAWTQPTFIKGAQVVQPLSTVVAGDWNVSVAGAGWSPDTTVTIDWVETRDECFDHPALDG